MDTNHNKNAIKTSLQHFSMVNLAMNTYMKSKFIENREGGDLPWSFRGNAKILLLISDTCCYFGDQKLSGGPRLLVAESWGGEGSPGTTGFEGGAHGDCGFERERSGGDGGGGGYMGIYNERKFRPALLYSSFLLQPLKTLLLTLQVFINLFNTPNKQ